MKAYAKLNDPNAAALDALLVGDVLRRTCVDPQCKAAATRIAAALAILNAVPDCDPATMTRAEVRTMWLAHHDACRVLRPEPESGR